MIKIIMVIVRKTDVSGMLFVNVLYQNTFIYLIETASFNEGVFFHEKR